MLTRRKSVFYSHKFKAYAKNKDVKHVVQLAEAFDLNVGYKYQKELASLKPTLSKDPFIAPFLPLLEALTPAIDPTDTEDIRAIYRQVDLDNCKGMECAVCLDEFGEGPHRLHMHDQPQKGSDGKIVFPRPVRLFRCDGHYFHRHCVMDWMEKHNTCPVCGTYYGKAIGTQPEGKMTVKKVSSKLPGHASCGTINIDFEFPSGTQGENHPHPGSAYAACRKTAYLPDNTEGQNVLKLFELAWERKILFKVDDRKSDDGAVAQIVENGISFKTVNKESSSVHAYPDPNYLEIAREQLQRKGVFLNA
jgi:deltex-like protein